MMEYEEPNDNNIESKLEHLHEMFCKTIYDEVVHGNINNIERDDLEEVLRYFAEKEQFEKCIVLKKALEKTENEKS